MSDTLVSLEALQRYAGRVKTLTDQIRNAINGRLTDYITDSTSAYIFEGV